MNAEKLSHIRLNPPATKGGEAALHAELGRLRARIQLWQDAMDKALEDKQMAEEEHERGVCLLQDRIAGLEADVATWRERALVAEAKLEAAKGGPHIVYNNYATHGGDNILGGQQNNTNQTSDMNIETLNINGGQNLIGDNGTLSIQNGEQKERLISPTQEQIINALRKLTERGQEEMKDVYWWGAWRFLNDYEFVRMNKNQFGMFLVDNGIVKRNLYENFRKPGGDVDNVLRIQASQWDKKSGSVSPSIQGQIDVANFLAKELLKQEG